MHNRQIRLIGLSILAIILILVLYTSSSDPFDITDSEFANNIINSHNNAKTDAAINDEIYKSQHSNQEEQNTNQDVIEEVVDEEQVESEFDPVKELLEIRSISPMVVFSKTYCPYSKKLKKLLSENYEITPEYRVVELDKHKHGKLLQDHLGAISGRRTVPNVLIGDSNESKGGCDDFHNLHESGKLLALLNEWGNKKLSVKKLGAPSNL